MTVIKEESGTYTVRCYYKDWRGERKQKVKRGFTKLKDAKQWEREFQSLEHCQVVNMDTLISAFISDMETKQATGKLKPTSVNTKKYNIECYITPFFKGTSIENITREVINKWIVDITGKSRRGERLSSSTINIVRNLLSQIFDYGIKHYKIKYNPVKESDCPTHFTSDTRATHWEVEEYEIFYNSLTKEVYRTLFNILYWGGLRIGEALALTPNDIRPNIITVNKTFIYEKPGRSYASTPKTRTSYRNVIIPDFLYQQINDYIKSLGNIQDSDRIFPFGRSTVIYWIKKAVKELNLPNASLHTMRHSYITNMLSVNEDYAVAAAQAGDTPATVFRNYAHARRKSVQISVDKLAELRTK